MAEFKLSFCFVVVLYLFNAPHLCYVTYADNDKFSSSLENVEVDKLLNSLNKPPVKSIKSPDGDIIDCVHVSHQPAFDHPLLKNHTIKMQPSYHPNLKNLDDTKVSSEMNASKVGPSSSSITQLWHSNGKCPKGTIPIRRTKKEDVLRANSVQSYGKKSSSFARQSLIGGPPPGHEYAIVDTKGKFYGSKAAFNLWNPSVQETNEFSLTQTWIVGGTYDSGLNTIEAGWQVSRQIYGDTNTRLFIYWTNNGYKQGSGCYNICPGFVQTNNKIAIGGSLSPTSQIDGSQYEITILIFKDGSSGNWWLQYNEEQIGYWPSSLFTYLKESASEVQWGGEVVNLESQGRHTTTQMGSGQFPNQGFRKASYVRKLEIVDQSNSLRTPIISYTLNKPGCYDISTRITNDNYWGTHFFYGGPGQNINCP